MATVSRFGSSLVFTSNQVCLESQNNDSVSFLQETLRISPVPG